MRILVTGGTGVIGAGVIPGLLRRNHEVVLLSRGAAGEGDAWPRQVEARPGDVTEPESVRGAADGCDAVVHITGIAEEKPPGVTFESVNVEGTRTMLSEAARAGVSRFVYISSLGADRGASAYHQSKRRAEVEVEAFAGEWVILRPGNVYGPGDEILSLLLKMVRALPAVPLVGLGDQPFEPVWFEDFAEAVARAVESPNVTRRILEVTGGETTTMAEVVERLGEITGRTVFAIPLPTAAAAAAAHLAGAVGVDFPLTEGKLTMLLEENRIAEGKANALTEVFSIEPTPLGVGLKRLAERIPDQTPKEGVGDLERKRFFADIAGSRRSPEELISIFRREYRDVFPIDIGVEGEGAAELEEGATISMALPVRGHIQIRVEEVAPLHVTFGTVEGHPLAGVVRFLAARNGETVRFTVEIHTRAASWLDFVSMKLGGEVAQRLNWITVVERMVERSGGEAPDGVRQETETLEEGRAGVVERWVDRLVTRRRRHENEDRSRAR